MIFGSDVQNTPACVHVGPRSIFHHNLAISFGNTKGRDFELIIDIARFYEKALRLCIRPYASMRCIICHNLCVDETMTVRVRAYAFYNNIVAS